MIRKNPNGILEIGEIAVTDLVKEYGTPLYVMDEQVIRDNCRVYTNAMDKHYGGNGLVLYASKAFSTKAIYKLAEQEKMGVDVVSAGELYTALAAGFPADKIYFHGNNKSDSELDYALEQGIYCFIVDNVFELEKLNKKAEKLGKVVNISFRIKPGIDAHTHDFIMTGQIDCKFGVALENGEAIGIVRKASGMNNVNLIGIHCHIGSQIFDLEPFESAAEVMLGFMADVKAEFGIEIKELNLGGGYGIKYTDEDDPIDFDKYIEAVSVVVKRVCSEKGLTVPKLIMEPGRSIVAAAGITLYSIGGIKEIEGIRNYVSVDGGMADNPRYALYEAKYDMCVANKMNEKADYKATIAGKCCESGDLLGKDVMIQKPEVDDLLAVFATGAYNYSMASHYNRIPNAAVVLVKDGVAREIVKRETFEQIIQNDVVPDDL